MGGSKQNAPVKKNLQYTSLAQLLFTFYILSHLQMMNSPKFFFALLLGVVLMAGALYQFVVRKNVLQGSLCLIAIPFFVGMTMGWGRKQS